MQKGPSWGLIKNKKMGLYFYTISHAIQVFFKVSFLGFVDASHLYFLSFDVFDFLIFIFRQREASIYVPMSVGRLVGRSVFKKF